MHLCFFNNNKKNQVNTEKTKQKAELRSTLIGMIGPIFWGTTPSLIILSGDVPVFQMTSMMFFCASLLSLALLSVKRIPPLALLKQKKIKQYLLLSLIGIFGINFLYIFALRLAPAGEAFLLLNTWQIISMLIAAKQSKNPLQSHEKIALLLCITGIVFLAETQSKTMGHSLTIGHAAALLAAFCWAFYSTQSARYNSVKSETLGLVFIISSALAALLHFIFEPQTIFPQTNSLFYIITLGLLPSGSAYIAWKHGIRHGNIRILSLLSYIGPLSAIFWLSFLNIIKLDFSFLAAFIFIFSGAVIGSKPRSALSILTRKSNKTSTSSPKSYTP